MTTDDPVFTVGDVIRKLRKAKHWSIRQLATETKLGGAAEGVGRMTISAIEHNPAHNYEKETLDALARAFGKTGAELEAMVTPPPKGHQRRASDSDLAPEWVAFTRRVMRLNRLAQSVLQMTAVAFEDAGAIRPQGGTPEGESSAVDRALSTTP